MLVLHPRTLTETAGLTPGGTVGVKEGVSDRVTAGGVFVRVNDGNIVTEGVNVITAGVEEFTPMTTGVGVYIEGVCVKGKKGVGGV